MTTTVQEFIKDKPPVEKVTSDDLLITAVRRMIGNDYSQLPVVDSNNCPVGIITSESILKALNNYATTLEKVGIKHAMLKKPQTFNQNIDLLDLFEDMSGHVALVIDDENRLVQIITDYDTAQYFRQRAQDIILVENIETTLRDYVQLAFGSNSDGQARLDQMIQTMTDASFSIRQKFERGLRHYLRANRLNLDDGLFDNVFEKKLFAEGVRSYLNALPEEETISFDEVLFEQVFEQHMIENNPLSEFDNLTLGNYIALFLHKDYWPYYAGIFGLEKSAVSNLLDGVRNTRNALSHFREIMPDQSIQLRDCYDLLNDHQQAIARAFAQDDTEASDVIAPDEGVEPGTKPETDTDHPLPPDDEATPGESRYAPLAIWLQSQPPEKELVKPTFAKIEEIIGGKLPESAYRNRAWWANDSLGHVQSKQWLDVGWRVAAVNMTIHVVRFARIKERNKAYIDFYSTLTTKLSNVFGFDNLNMLPDGSNWHYIKSIGEGKNLANIHYSFGRDRSFRIELYIDSGDGELNKKLFDKLMEQKEIIEQEIGTSLQWQRLDNKRASRISQVFHGHITDEEKALNQLIEKVIPATVNFISLMDQKVNEQHKKIYQEKLLEIEIPEGLIKRLQK